MKAEIPIYVRATESTGGRPPVYRVSPLFFPQLWQVHERLERATANLETEVRKHLRRLGKNVRHDELAEWLYCPEIDSHRLKLRVALRKQSLGGRLLLVMFRSLNRRIAFAPGIPELWFEVPPTMSLEARATEVLGEHLRKRERDEDEPGEWIASTQAVFSLRAEWISCIDVHWEATQVIPPRKEPRFALFESPPPRDGEEELETCGRSLLSRYPDDLDRAAFREQEVEELRRWLATENRPILLLGPPGVGKTTLVEECVFREAQSRDERTHSRRDFWWLSPQRLISGMSYVGQWEGRLLEIVKAARKRRHVLVFDDLLGLFQAGQSSCSSLCVADVLRPHLERGDIRLLAEATPETWRILRERDRSFADLFRVFPVPEPSETDACRILIAVMARLEGSHRCRFDVDVLPTVITMQRRYVRDSALPGKAATFLRRLATKYSGKAIGRAEAMSEFQSHSGLSLTFLDERLKLSRREVLAELQAGVVGQPRALGAAADAVLMAKARINDPSRPLATFLFLGPTGVGKTQTAQTLAKFLYGDANQLVRIDMNEFVSPDAVARLVGTFHEPEGLLTAAIRRQPFAVLLLDEIEKAHPQVFDLLLQVLGEGRLTDAIGRTTDFTNTLIILTSNLGVRRSQTGLGFDPPGHDDERNYSRAAEEFFRPEFFNRLDRVVPFGQLERADVRRIADSMMAEILRREGLRRRRCAMKIEPAALRQIVDLAYDPVLGARALRRGLERQIVQPIAAQLAQGLPDAPVILRIYPGTPDVQVRLVPLVHAEVSNQHPLVIPDDRRLAADKFRHEWRKLDCCVTARKPVDGFQAGAITSAQQSYLAIRERLLHARQTLERLEGQGKRPTGGGARAPHTPHGRLRPSKVVLSNRSLAGLPKRQIASDLASTQDLHAYLRDLHDQAREGPAEGADDGWRELAAELHLIRRLVDEPEGTGTSTTVLVLDSIGNQHVLATNLVAQAIQRALVGWSPVEATPLENDDSPAGRRCLRIDGAAAPIFAELEVGTHLVCPAGLGFTAVRVRHVTLSASASIQDWLGEEASRREQWLQELAAGKDVPAHDPDGWPPVVRIYDLTGFVLDVRTNSLAAGVLRLAGADGGLTDTSAEDLATIVRQSMRERMLG